MITVKELVDNELNNTIKLIELYLPKRGLNGKKFVNEPFESQAEFLESFEYGLDDPWDDIEDPENEEYDDLVRDAKIKIIETYKFVSMKREEFLRTL